MRLRRQIARFTTLSIESSCDDSCIAIAESEFLEKKTTHSSINRAFKGVFPFLISSCHETALSRNLEKILKSRKNEAFQRICYTAGPGQYQSLSKGFYMAKILASAFSANLVPVHHMEGHIYSSNLPCNQFPFLSILLSGGHTLIVLVMSSSEYTVLARSLDDNIGECYDKIVRELPLKLRGTDLHGGVIEKLAAKCTCESSNIYETSKFQNLSFFSYSGLKSEVIKDLVTAKHDNDYFYIACKFQRSIQFNITKKLELTVDILQELRIRPLFIALGGGVSMNMSIRDSIKCFGEKMGLNVYYPIRELCTDNASMIAKACLSAKLDSRSARGALNPIPDFPLGFLKEDDNAIRGYIST